MPPSRSFPTFPPPLPYFFSVLWGPSTYVQHNIGHHGTIQATKDEPVANFEFCFSFEEEEPSKHRLQELMWEEMRRYHPEQGPWRGRKNPSPAGPLGGVSGTPIHAR